MKYCIGRLSTLEIINDSLKVKNTKEIINNPKQINTITLYASILVISFKLNDILELIIIFCNKSDRNIKNI
jgi:hypothetical protein